MVDVYVALKQLKRIGPATRPVGLAGKQLEQVLMGMAVQFPDNVKVVR